MSNQGKERSEKGFATFANLYQSSQEIVKYSQTPAKLDRSVIIVETVETLHKHLQNFRKSLSNFQLEYMFNEVLSCGKLS